MVPALTGVSRIAAGSGISFAIEDDGTGSGPVWAWGANTSGQLGDGSAITRTMPVQVSGMRDAVTIAAGQNFAFAITRTGTLWGWGDNTYGQIGDNTNTTRFQPVQLLFPTPVHAIAAGQYHSVAATTDGHVWSWGNNSWSTLGDDSPGRNHPEAIDGVSGALLIASGPNSLHTLVAQPDGALLSWGYNWAGQVGDGSTVTRIAPVSVSGLGVAPNAWLVGDADDDGLRTWKEYLIGTDPLDADTNRDGLRDGAAVSAGLTATSPDVDGDGIANWVEHAQGTDPFTADSDGDGVADAADCFPLDVTRSACLPADPNDHTPPVITLIEPTTARRIS